jgi:chromosomal replication initiator protein
MATDPWAKLLANLEKSLNPGIFAVWIRPLGAEIQGRRLTLLAPNEFVAAWVRDRLLDAVREAATPVLGFAPEVQVQVRPAPQPAPQPAARPEPRETPLALPIVQAPRPQCAQKWRFSFEDFVVGPSNEHAAAASKGLCRDHLPEGQLFLSSGPGLGKTHLLHAIGRTLCETPARRPLSVACLTAEEFATRLILAIRAREVARFKAEFRDAVDVLLLEDVHFFQGKEKMQDELLCTLKALQARGCKIVFTSSFLPKDLANLDSQLVSSFCSGVLAAIGPPEFETRKRIVERKARGMRVAVPDAVSTLLAERIPSDIRQLESCLNNLVLKARLLNQQVSLDLAWQVLENYAAAKAAPGLEQIIDFICRRFDLSKAELFSKSRRQDVVLARNTAFFLARKHTGLSLAAIGERLGRKHSTVLKGITNVEREISRQSPLGRQLERTVNLLIP